MLAGSQCVVMTFSSMAGAGGVVFDSSAKCPIGADSRPLILPLYCNDTELDSGAGFELFGTTDTTSASGPGWSAAASARAGKAPGTIVLAMATSKAAAAAAAAAAGRGVAAAAAASAAATAPMPTRVRYAYADWPVASVRNGPAGHSLPARPFDVPVAAPQAVEDAGGPRPQDPQPWAPIHI